MTTIFKGRKFEIYINGIFVASLFIMTVVIFVARHFCTANITTDYVRKLMYLPFAIAWLGSILLAAQISKPKE